MSTPAPLPPPRYYRHNFDLGRFALVEELAEDRAVFMPLPERATYGSGYRDRVAQVDGGRVTYYWREMRPPE